MRLRHISGCEDIVKENKYVISSYNDSIFLNDNPLHIEIGMGKGDFIINMAKKYPNVNFVGIEKYPTVLLSAIKKLETENLNNLRLMVLDAKDIDTVFDKSVDLVYLNFSDPWPKARHAKRRLTSQVFLKKYDHVFKSAQHIVMKTDNRKLFEFSLIEFINYDYKIVDISLDLYKDPLGENVATEYEKKFNALGFPIYKIEVKK